MPFLWLDVDDEPGPLSDRGLIETGSIALLSARSNPRADHPSRVWLGSFADRDTIRESGLWNVNHVDGPLRPDLLDVLDRHIHRARRL